MTSANRSLSKLPKLLTAALASLMLFAFGMPMLAQSTAVGNVQVKGLPDDWTHHHLVFSNPGTEEDAVKKNQQERWSKVVNDPRYVIQQLKRGTATQGPAGPEITRIQAIRGDAWQRSIGTGAKTTKIEKDWSTPLGGSAASATGTFTGNPTATQSVTVDGTKLTPSISAQATGKITIGGTSCFENGDGVTIGGISLTTNATGGSGALTVATNPTSTVTAVVGSITYTIESGNPGTNANRVLTGTSAALTAQNLAAAINDNTASCGTTSNGRCFGSNTAANAAATATASGAVVSLTGKCGGTGPVTLTKSSNNDITVSTAWNGGSNGTTSGTSFALNSATGAPTASSIATQLIAAITANTSTGVTATSGGTGAVDLTAVTGGTAGNVAVTSTADSGVTLTGMTGGTAGTNTGLDFAVDFNTTDNATNLAAAIARNIPAVSGTTSSGPTVTVTATAAGTAGNGITLAATLSNFTWSGSDLNGGLNAPAAVQPNAYPAKYGVSLTAASCSDFAVYPTGRAGATGAATIVAYDNLYTGGCTGTVPAAYWAYNTGNGEYVTTSPIISQDGTQVAFIESNGTTASLVLLKWAAETGETVNTPLTLTNQTLNTDYQTCTPSAAVPCMFTIAFANGDDDSISAPFYDYTGDVLYVGDNNGNLHRFTGVLNGAPAEDTTSPWPVALGSNELASPVFDDTWNAVFVGDLGGTLYCVTATTGSCTTATTIGNGWYEASVTPASTEGGGGGGQIADAPLINSSANYVLVFVNTGTANSVYGFSEQFFSGGEGGPVPVGTGATNHYLYAGAFDNVYYDSANNTGNLYVVGNTGATTGASLYQVGFSSGNLTGGVTAVVSGLTTNASNAYPWPSPLTEFCNNGGSPCGAAATQTITGCTINRTTTITCPAGTTFTASLVGATVSGTDIPSGSTISTVPSLTSITISKTTTGNTTITLTVGAAATSPGTDYVFFSVNRGNVAGCTNTAGNGCILSYNVTNPSSIAISGTGQNLVTPGTSGCWATGGLSIDNSAITTGASQIYFVNLDGATAGGAGTPTSSLCTAGTAAINAVQASQANP